MVWNSNRKEYDQKNINIDRKFVYFCIFLCSLVLIHWYDPTKEFFFLFGNKAYFQHKNKYIRRINGFRLPPVDGRIRRERERNSERDAIEHMYSHCRNQPTIIIRLAIYMYRCLRYIYLYYSTTGVCCSFYVYYENTPTALRYKNINTIIHTHTHKHIQFGLYQHHDRCSHERLVLFSVFACRRKQKCNVYI